MTEIKIGTEEHSSIYLTNYLLGAEHTVAQDNDNMMFVQYAYSYYVKFKNNKIKYHNSNLWRR